MKNINSRRTGINVQLIAMNSHGPWPAARDEAIILACEEKADVLLISSSFGTYVVSYSEIIDNSLVAYEEYEFWSPEIEKIVRATRIEEKENCDG